MTNAVEKFKPQMSQPVGNVNNLRGLGEVMRGEITKVIPQHLTPDRMLKALLVAASKNPDLYNCTQESITKSLMDASTLGLDCSGTLGSGYLVPFNNRKKGGLDVVLDDVIAGIYSCAVLHLIRIFWLS